ncbi:MAG: hypothetical protein Q9207_005114 [Kuettlingeria erythrocarpa]
MMALQQVADGLLHSHSESGLQIRGGLFDSNRSSTWSELGYNSLGLEANLYPPDNATFGLDTVALGFANLTGGATLESQIVASIAGYQNVLGIFGLGQQPTNLTDFSDPHPSYLASLHAQRMIPSLSWGYTAGARYRLKGVLGSLTLGGFDAARFSPNNVSFSLAPDVSRDLVVGLQSITSTENDGSKQLLLPSAHLTFIDSTVPEIYLPLDVCESFERIFNLVWNTTFGLYLVDDELHQSLITRNPNFTFGISDSTDGGTIVEIMLPYSSFDLTYKYSFDQPAIRYFPILRAMNDTQLTLGRVFLQEIYLITDYERGNFSVSQARFEEPMKQRIVPILPLNANLTADPPPEPSSTQTVPQNEKSGLGLPTTAGIIAGALSGCLILLTLCCLPCILRRHRKRKQPKRPGAMYSSAEDIRRMFAVNGSPSQTSENQSYPSLQSLKDVHGVEHANIPEIDRNSRNFRHEVHNDYKIELPENARTFELSNSLYGATPNQTDEQPVPPRPTKLPLSPRRRNGMVLSTSGTLSTGSIVKYWMRSDGLRASQSESCLNREVFVPNGSIPLSAERPLPPTPIDDSPQSAVFPASAWIKVAARRHEQEDALYPLPLRTQGASLPHRRGFFS